MNNELEQGSEQIPGPEVETDYGAPWLFGGLDTYGSRSLGLNVGPSGLGHQGDGLAAHRGSVVQSRPLSPVVLPCLHRHLLKSMSLISDIFPSSAMSPELTYLSMLSYGSTIPPVCRPRLLLLGGEGVGLDHLGPAILHELEKFPIHSLGLLPSLLSYPGAKTPEEALLHIFTEARRTTPSILYIPTFNKWWGNAHQQLRDVFLSLLEELPSDLPILLLATSYGELSDLGGQSVFDRQSVYTVDRPSSEDRSLFFDRLFEAAFSFISGLYGKPDGSQPLISDDLSGPVKELVMEHTKNYTIAQMGRLYSRIMKGVLGTLDKGLGDDNNNPKESVLSFLLDFAQNQANFLV